MAKYDSLTGHSSICFPSWSWTSAALPDLQRSATCLAKTAITTKFPALRWSLDTRWRKGDVDENDLVIAHPDGSLVGLDLKGPLGTDANGYDFGLEMLSADEDGRWVSYVYGNPETRPIGTAFGELQLKNTWVVRHDGLLFGSGWYVDADEFTKSFVAAAVSKFHAVGLEGTMEYFTASESDFAGLAAAIDYYNSIETVTA